MKDALIIVTPIYEDTQSAEQLISELKNEFKKIKVLSLVLTSAIMAP